MLIAAFLTTDVDDDDNDVDVDDDDDDDGTGENILLSTVSISGFTDTFFGVSDSAGAGADDDDDCMRSCCLCLINDDDDDDDDDDESVFKDDSTSVDDTDDDDNDNDDDDDNDDNSSLRLRASSSNDTHLVVSLQILTISTEGSKGPCINNDDDNDGDVFQSIPRDFKYLSVASINAMNSSLLIGLLLIAVCILY